MKTKTILLSLFLMLASIGLWAQEKYDLIIASNDVSYVYITTKDSSTVLKVEKGEFGLLKLLKKVDELQNAGWEVYNSVPFSDNRYDHVYYLRKKKN